MEFQRIKLCKSLNFIKFQCANLYYDFMLLFALQLKEKFTVGSEATLRIIEEIGHRIEA